MERRSRLFSLPPHASCPHCHALLSRHHSWDAVARPCENCGRQIKPICEGGWICHFISYSVVLLIAVSMWGGISRWWSFLPAIVGLIIEVAAVVWLWPYMNKFQAAPSATIRHCPRCSYDLRATPDHCPECGLMVPVELQATESANVR